MSVFNLESRPTSPASLGRAILFGVFAAVAIMFAARWFVALDSSRLSPGDNVTTVFGMHTGELVEINGDTATIRHGSGEVYTAPIEEVTER